MRICVYTAIFGGYDHLLQPVPQDTGCDFICFTDRKGPARDGAWRVITSNENYRLNPRLRAKYFKIQSHEVFPGGRLAWRYDRLGLRRRYDVVIWVDGCLRIKDPGFARAFAGHIRENGLSMFVHPDRDCIYQEVLELPGMRKYAGLPVFEQAAAYRAEGFPEKSGLIAGGLIARKTRLPAIAKINEAWWRENLRWTYQDQLSLPVVLWRQGHGYDPVELNLWDNPWFDRLEHTSEY
jgi:hypothetical protein